MGSIASIIKENSFCPMGKDLSRKNQVRLAKTYVMYSEIVEKEAKAASEKIEETLENEDI